MRSPLIIGGEMTKFDKFTLDLVTNEEILKMHKNARHSHQVWRKEIGGVEHVLWVASCAKGGFYLAVFNAGEADSEIEISLEDIEIDSSVAGKELWSGETVTADGKLSVKLPKHGAKAYLFNAV